MNSSTFPVQRQCGLLAALALLLLTMLLPGCLSMPRILGGSGDMTLTLDGEQVHAATLARGQTLTLDMRDPAASGYGFAGASFDPDLLRLEGIERLAGGRVRYLFSATAKGESDIQIKIKKDEPGYRPDVYKRVRVSIQ
jgi:hypothetical protein